MKLKEVLDRCLENRREKIRREIAEEDPEIFAAMLRCEAKMAANPERALEIYEGFERELETIPVKPPPILRKMLAARLKTTE